MLYSIINVLLIEDNVAEARLLREFLSESDKTTFNIVHVKRLHEALEELENNHDYNIILLDLTLPDSQNLDSLNPLSEKAPALPIIVLTNTDDEELALDAVRQGAQDYLVKRYINQDIISRSIHYAIERKQIQETLKTTNQQLTKINQCLEEEIAKRQKVQEELERSNQELEQFAYVVSHDLKQPLTTIYSWTQMLQRRYETIFDAKGKKYMYYILSGTKRMNALIDALLAYSRVGRREINLESIDCHVILDNVQEILQTAIARNNAIITYHSLPTLMADPTQLEQLFQNLIDNAIKYRREEPPEIHISATLNSNKNNSKKLSEWIFAFQDNGLGIAQEDQERVFGIFQRLHQDDEYSGSGVGLAICQKIVERHHGRIWIESEVGKGSTFYFSIPQNI